MGWQKDLRELLGPYFGDETVEEGTQALAAVGRRHPEEHRHCLRTLEAGIEAAAHGDDEVGRIIQDSWAYDAETPEEARKWLTKVRGAYLARYEELITWQASLRDLFTDWLSDLLTERAARFALTTLRHPDMHEWVLNTIEAGLGRLTEGDREALRIVRRRFGRQVRSADDARAALEEARDLYLALREEAIKNGSRHPSMPSSSRPLGPRSAPAGPTT